MPSESIASPKSSPAMGESCPGCGAPLAGDQRYCLECGERRAPASSALLGGPPPAAAQGPTGLPPAALAPEAPIPPGDRPGHGRVDGPRGSAVTVIAGVGVLLLAMGVGVLIGRSGGGSKPAAVAPVISVSTAPANGAGASASESAALHDDWPAGTDGYTVQLQLLPQASTQPSAVEAAKAAATAKGAKAVGALNSADFSSLKAGSYIVYSGVYTKKPDAEKAVSGLKKSFPGAKVIKVSSGAGGAGATSGGASTSGAGAGNGASHPAPPKAAEELSKTHGKSYEEKSKNLPNQVET